MERVAVEGRGVVVEKIAFQVPTVTPYPYPLPVTYRDSRPTLGIIFRRV